MIICFNCKTKSYSIRVVLFHMFIRQAGVIVLKIKFFFLALSFQSRPHLGSFSLVNQCWAIIKNGN